MKRVVSKILLLTMVINIVEITPIKKINNLDVQASENEIREAGQLFIADPNLERAIRNQIGYDEDLTIDAMKRITTLYANSSYITDLSGLEYATNLESLYLAENNIEDITPLKNLTSLKFITLNKNKIKNIDSLEKLELLDSLHLDNNRIESISSLKNKKMLLNLYLNDNNIIDISPLKESKSLTNLYFNNNNVSDISMLSLNNIINISANKNKIKDISVLSNTSKLENIYMSENEIEDITPIANKTNMQNVFFDRNKINTIGNFSQSSTIRQLLLFNNNISDIGGLKNIKSIKELRLDNNNISDISPLSNIAYIERLNLEKNNIEDISPLKNSTILTKLYLNNNNISDISHLSRLVSLEQLYLSSNRISDFTPLKMLGKLIERNGLWADFQRIDLEGEEVNNGEQYVFVAPKIIDIDGNTIPLESLEFNNQTYYPSNNKIIIPNVTDDGEIVVKFNQKKYNNNISGSFYKKIKVIRKPIDEVLNVNDIKTSTKAVTEGEYVSVFLDINSKIKDNNIRKIEIKYNENIYVLTSDNNIDGKYVCEIATNSNYGVWELKSVSVIMEKGDKYILTRENIPIIKSGDFTVNKGLDSINIPDKNLECAIREALMLNNDEPISEIKMKSLGSLSLGSKNNVIDLTGLEYASNLTEIGIVESNINDMSVISKLSRLKSIYISGCKLTDIEFVSGLRNLEKIDCTNNKIRNIEALKELINLKNLNLAGNNIKDISAIAELVNLENVNLDNNWVTIIPESLNNLTKLKSMSIKGQFYSMGSVNTIREKVEIENPYNILGKIVEPDYISGNGKAIDNKIFWDKYEYDLLEMWISKVLNISGIDVKYDSHIAMNVNFFYKEDVNRDNLVNIEDLSLVALKYNKTSKDEDWNTYEDVNGDEVLDLYDLAIISKKLN